MMNNLDMLLYIVALGLLLAAGVNVDMGRFNPVWLAAAALVASLVF